MNRNLSSPARLASGVQSSQYPELTQIFMFRHGETDWNVQQRFQGHIDVPLNEKGFIQAQELVPFLVQQKIEAVLSSDLSRTTQTAQPIADALGIAVFRTEHLREAFLGEAQGLTREEMLQRFGIETVGRWRSSLISDADVSYPGGESANQILARSFRAIREFLHSHSFTRIGLSTHGGSNPTDYASFATHRNAAGSYL